MWNYDDDDVDMDEYDADISDDGMDADDDFADTDVLMADDDGDDDDDSDFSDGPVDEYVGDSSVVFDVDNLVAEFEAEGMSDKSASSRLRRRLEAIAERKRRHNDLLDFDDYDI